MEPNAAQNQQRTTSAQALHACAEERPCAATARSGEGAQDPVRLQVLNRILAAHEGYFDVQREYEYAGRFFQGYGEFHSHGQKYVLVKRATLWEVDAHEHVFLAAVEHLDLPWLADAVAFMKEHALAKVDPQPNHMCTNLTLVVVADQADDDAWRLLRKTRFRKNFAWGFRGWSDLRLAAIDLSGDRVATNAAGKPLADTLRSCMG